MKKLKRSIQILHEKLDAKMLDIMKVNKEIDCDFDDIEMNVILTTENKGNVYKGIVHNGEVETIFISGDGKKVLFTTKFKRRTIYDFSDLMIEDKIKLIEKLNFE